jgi:carboxypeptidase Q
MTTRFRFRPALKLSAVLWIFAPLWVLAAGETPEVDRIIAAGKEDSQVMEHLDILCNRIGPRLTSSDNLQNACEWARDRFKSFGLENAHLEEWGEFPVGFNRGPATGRMVEPEDKALKFGTNSWTAGTRGLTKGRAVLAPENDEQLADVKSSLPGAWVLAPRAVRGRGPGGGQAGQQPTADELEFRKKRDAAYEEAGIAGLVRSTSGDLILTSGSQRITWDKLPKTPTIDLQQKQWNEIAALLKDKKPVVLEFDIRNYFKKGPIKLYNVIADIPGAETPDEYVVVGGHIDSWDGATGATDNGTGCATTLEAARLIMKAGVKPKRTIRFMLWSGEEQGLLGSRAYVAAHKDLMPKISAVLVHDMGTNYLSSIGGTEAMMADLEAVAKPIIALDASMPFKVRKIAGFSGGMGGSDHASFTAGGAPGFFWGQSGKAVYGTTHHTQHDTYDTAIPEYQKHSSVVVALASFGIANLDHLLSREKMIAPPQPGGGFGGRGRRGEATKKDETKKDDAKKDETKKDETKKDGGDESA